MTSIRVNQTRGF